jgi:DNA mismatch repair protein MutH
MGSELSSRTDNAAALEGLAAASNSIKDTNTRSQYNTHVDNAVNKAVQSGKYSSEEIAQMKKDIQQARETGMTKAETAQAKKTQEEVKTATQKAQQQQKAEQKAQKEALEQKKQTVLNYAKTVIATATASKPKASTSTATSSHTQAIEDAQKSLNQTLERLAKAQSVAETDRVRRELMMRIEQFQAEVRISQEERDLRIQLSEREVVNALLAESAAEEEAQASQDAQEAIAVATDTEVTAEDGATAEVRSQAEKSGLSTEAVQELQNAYSSGGLVALYDKAATIVGSKAQEKLLNYISHASSSTLHSFADAHSNNKHVLMTLFKNSKDPYIMQLLIRNGYASEVLGSGAVSVKDFMAHASAQTVANWLVDLQKTGATYTLKQAFEHLQDDSKAMASSLIPGSDEWRQAQQTRMSTASAEQTDNLSQTDPARTASASVSSNGLFEEYEGLALGSDRVRMGIPVDKKVDKRFFRMG